MTRRLRYAAGARRDFLDALAWYERERAGLGQEFMAELEQVTSEAVETPDRHAPAFDSDPLPADLPPVRQAFLRRFPYRVVFAEISDGIRVLAVAHKRRRPGYWHGRLA